MSILFRKYRHPDHSRVSRWYFNEEAYKVKQRNTDLKLVNSKQGVEGDWNVYWIISNENGEGNSKSKGKGTDW